jgi:diketogulonate reductase-like aldo/keto reductase
VLALLGSAATLASAKTMAQPADALLARKAAAAGVTLPVVGVGTWQTFDVGRDATERAELIEVLRTLVQYGGSVVDSSPMYGRAEAVVGELAAQASLHGKLFLATKVWTRGQSAGAAQMEDSLRLLRTPAIDLMQVHNLVDWRTQLKTMKAWQADGRIRHIGITHYHAGAYDELAAVMRTRAFGFVQLNYSMAEREAEERLLPLAAELGMGVLVNRPFSQGGLFPRVKGKPLPAWAAELDCASWAQFFLKWILGHAAVTCVIPGTRLVAHMKDNLAAGRGRLPDAAQRARMLEHLRTL